MVLLLAMAEILLTSVGSGLASHDYRQRREKRQLKAIFAFCSPWDALYPFLMQSCLKEDHVKCQELPQCLLGNSFWSLNKWLVANSAVVSIVFITLVSIMCRFLCFFSTVKELNWQPYIWFVLDKNILEFTMWLLSFGILCVWINHCIKD